MPLRGAATYLQIRERSAYTFACRPVEIWVGAGGGILGGSCPIPEAYLGDGS